MGTKKREVGSKEGRKESRKEGSTVKLLKQDPGLPLAVPQGTSQGCLLGSATQTGHPA